MRPVPWVTREPVPNMQITALPPIVTTISFILARVVASSAVAILMGIRTEVNPTFFILVS